MQKKQILETQYKILRQLHKRRYRHGRPLRIYPYSYEELWKWTKIHRNTLRRRLDELVSHGIISRRTYRRRHHRLSNHNIYFVDEMTWLRTSKARIKSVYYPPSPKLDI